MTRMTPDLAPILQTSGGHMTSYLLFSVKQAQYTLDLWWNIVWNLEPSGFEADTLPLGYRGLFHCGKHIEAHEKHFPDQLGTHKHTTEIAHYGNSNGEHDIILGGRKVEVHEKHFLDQRGTNRNTTQIAHDENKDGNEEYPNILEHDVIVGGIEAHEEHVSSHSGSIEHTTQMMHIEFLDDNKKYLDKSQNPAIPGGSKIQTHGQHVINQDSNGRNVLKIEHNENPNTNKEEFFNKRGHGIILGGNKTDIHHLLVVEIKDLKNAKSLEHTDGNEEDINDHEVFLDGSATETRDKHTTKIALSREDPKESIKVEYFDKKGDHLRKRLHNTSAFENTEYLKERAHAEFSSESKDGKNGSEHAAAVKNKQNINQRNYRLSNNPIRYEPDHFGFYDYYDLLSQVAAFKGTSHHLKLTRKTKSPSVDFDKKSLNIKEEITSPGTASTQFPLISSSPVSHSITNYARPDLTSYIDQNTFHVVKTTQRTKIHSVIPQPSYSTDNYLKQAHQIESTSMFSKNSENDKAKYAPLLATSSQFLSTSSSPISRSIRARTDQTVTHKNNLHQSKTTRSFKIYTKPFTIKYATSNNLKRKFKTASTSYFNHPASYKTKDTPPIIFTTEFFSSSSSLNSQGASEYARRLHLLPSLHQKVFDQIKTTQKTKILTTLPPSATLKPILNYVIMCKTINATKFDSQPLVFRRRSNPVHRFPFIQRRSFSQEKKNIFVSTPQPPTMVPYKVQKVEIGPREYTVCGYHHYTTKRSLYQPSNSNKSSFRHISTPFKISSNDYADSGEKSIGTFVPKIHTKLKIFHNSDNLHGKTFNINSRRKAGIHLHNQNWLVTKNHYSPRSNVYEYVIAPRTSASKSKQFFTQATVTLPTFNRKHKTVVEKLSEPISEFVTRNFKSTAHKNGFYQVSTKDTYKILTEKPIKSMHQNYPLYSNNNAHFSSTQREDNETRSSTVSENINKKFHENEKNVKYAQSSFKHYTFPRTRRPISISTIYSSTSTPVYLSISYPETLDKITQDSFTTKHSIPAVMTTPVKTSMFRPSPSDTKDSSILKTTYPSYSQKRNIPRIAQEKELTYMNYKPITYIPHTVTTKRNRVLVKTISNYPQTAASLFPSRRTKNIDEKANYPSYSTKESIRRITLEPKKYISHNKPITLFPDSVTAKWNQGFQKPSSHYSDTLQPYSSTSKTKHTSRHATFPSYSTEQNIYRISKESEGFTSYNKPISYSVYVEKKRTKNTDKTATFSQQEPVTNAQKSGMITTSTESTNVNANIYSTEEYTTISNKKHESLISEDQLKVYKNKFYYPTLIQRNTSSTKQLAPIYSLYTTTDSSYTRGYKIAETVTKDTFSHSSNQKPTMLMTPSTIKSFDYNSRITRPSTGYELKRGKTKAYLTLPISQYLPLITQKPPKVFVSNPSTYTLTHRFKNKPTTVDDKNEETDILLSPRVSEKDNIRPPSDLMLYWLCYRSMHLGENNQNCAFNQRQTEQITSSFDKIMKPSVESTSMHLTTDTTDKEFSQTAARSNFLQTTALSYPPRRTKTIEAKLVYPSYSIENSIRRKILEPEESTSHKKPVTLFSYMVTAKRNQRFRQSTAHYFDTLQPYSSTSRTKRTTEHAISPSYSTEQNTYRNSQESKGFTSYNKPVSYFPYSFPAEKKGTKNERISATFSRQEPFTNAQKSRLITTSTESTNFNANIYSTEDYASISNKKHISLTSEEQLNTSENYQLTTPSVHHHPIEEPASNFTSMKYKPFITYSLITTPDNLHSTTSLPLLIRTPLADNGEYSPKAISSETTNNARMENQPRNFKPKYLPQDPKRSTGKYLSSPFSVKSTFQTIDESKFYYPTLSQKNTMLSTKQPATTYSIYTTGASSYTRDYKIANTLAKESYSHSFHHKPTTLMTPNTIKSFNYYSRFTPPSVVYDLKRDETRAYLTLPILQYKPLVTQKPQKVIINKQSTSAFAHPFRNKPTTVDDKNNKETDILLSTRVSEKDNIRPPSDLMLYWLCYRSMHLGKNNKNFNFSQQQTEPITNNFCEVMKSNVASTSMQHITDVTDKDLQLDIFQSHFTPSILNSSKVSPGSHLSIDSRVLRTRHSNGQINNAHKPEEYVSIHNMPTTRLPLRMKVDNFQSNYLHLTMTKSDFLASPFFFQKSETYKGHFSNKATEAYSSFTPEPSDSSTIHLPSNIHAHKFSTWNSFNHQPRYISKSSTINIKTVSSSNQYTVSPYNRKNTLKLHDIHKTLFSNTQRNYLATKLYIPYIFKQRIATSSPTLSSVQYQQKSNIPKFSPRLYTSILASKNGNPTIKFPSYIKRQPTKSTSLDSTYKTTHNRNPNNSKFSSRLYTTNFSATQNDNTTTKLPSYIVRQSTKSTSLDYIYTTSEVRHPIVDTTDSLSNTEYSLKSDKVLRYTKKNSENSLSTEPSNQPSRKSLDHLTNSVPNTSPSSKPETVLENPEFYKIPLSKEVSAIEKFKYFSTKLPLYLRLKETIRRKSSKGESRRTSVKRFTVNMPEFTAKDQNKTVPTQQNAPELNVAQQSGEDLGRRRGRPGGGGGRKRSGFKTSPRLGGRPAKIKD
ncbi:hypothetical protein AVEN_152644-1 [Araneus ventricosus]|uniref:Uncharacterized protein n=1 Tax=Araneus ventricosus TaxID=182803 RepID=A0A4Y2NDK1_ARAVE|nr:hypothetical protein AVEN_152644-1 [Araneus ventricosus]